MFGVLTLLVSSTLVCLSFMFCWVTFACVDYDYCWWFWFTVVLITGSALVLSLLIGFLCVYVWVAIADFSGYYGFAYVDWLFSA